MKSLRNYISKNNKKYFAGAVNIIFLYGLVFSAVVMAQNGMLLNDTGYLGIGTDTPQRQLHLVGPNAVFRMDRTTNSSSFLITRTDSSGRIYKGFLFGVNGYSPGVGEFFISDMGAASTGGGKQRMLIDNTGGVKFEETVTAKNFVSTSSVRYKKDIQPIEDAMHALEKLQGVRFNWKDSGKPSIGFIAEDLAKVFPEIVENNTNSGAIEGVNYSALISVLVEALKEMHEQVTLQQTLIASQGLAIMDQRNDISKLQEAIDDIGAIKVRLYELEDSVQYRRLKTASTTD